MSNKKALLFLIFLITLITLSFWLKKTYPDQFSIEYLHDILSQAGIWAPLAFIGFYALWTVLFLPGVVSTLLGGLLFGALWGTLYNLIGAVIGATGSFLIARYLAHDWVEKKAGGKLKQLLEGINKEGWRFVATVRLIPFLPFNLLNYALGLTAIGLIPYIIASAIFMMPGTFAYSYIGSLGEIAINGGGQHWVGRISLGVGFLVVLACLPWLKKQLGKK